MFAAISQRNVPFRNLRMDGLETNYFDFFLKFRVKLIPMPNIGKDVINFLAKIQVKFIILSGGNNVNPRLYDKNAGFDPDSSIKRDETEKAMIGYAVKNKLPVLGLCRGIQFINVYFNGSLIKDLKGENYNHVGITHSLSIVDKKAEKFFGKKTFKVNSYHNQGIDKKCLSNELKAFAISDDGLIEGAFHPRYPIAGVIWHPERESPDNKINEKIINAFLERKLFWKEI